MLKSRQHQRLILYSPFFFLFYIWFRPSFSLLPPPTDSFFPKENSRFQCHSLYALYVSSSWQISPILFHKKKKESKEKEIKELSVSMHTQYGRRIIFYTHSFIHPFSFFFIIILIYIKTRGQYLFIRRRRKMRDKLT